MVQIDINKLIADFLNDKEDIGNQIQRAARNTVKQMLHHALQKQGLRIKDGEIVVIREPTDNIENTDKSAECEDDKIKQAIQLACNAMRFIVKCGGRSLEQFTIDFPEAIEIIKSFCPQSQWKPSDEQMESLKKACDEHWEPDGLDTLYTLYQDLKKLMEE